MVKGEDMEKVTCFLTYYCRAHPTPVLSQTLLVPNFFTHFLLQEGLTDEYDVDLGLEYEQSELYKEFMYACLTLMLVGYHSHLNFVDLLLQRFLRRCSS